MNTFQSCFNIKQYLTLITAESGIIQRQTMSLMYSWKCEVLLLCIRVCIYDQDKIHFA